jgi:hypothetical protein
MKDVSDITSSPRSFTSRGNPLSSMRGNNQKRNQRITPGGGKPTKTTTPLNTKSNPTSNFNYVSPSTAPIATQVPSNNSSKEIQPEGLLYVEDFLTEEEERHLLEQIDQCEWSTALSRRTQQYGFRFDYPSQDLDLSKPIPFPIWARTIEQKLSQGAFELPSFNQLIVNGLVLSSFYLLVINIVYLF